jgi:hypothetical protein
MIATWSARRRRVVAASGLAIALMALGASGAVTWFAPLQPVLAMLSIALMVVALRLGPRNEASCEVPARR